MGLRRVARVGGRSTCLWLVDPALLAGLWAGLVPVGWPSPPVKADLVLLDGPLMLAGFLGLVTSLELWRSPESRAFCAPPLAGVAAAATTAGGSGLRVRARGPRTLIYTISWDSDARSVTAKVAGCFDRRHQRIGQR